MNFDDLELTAFELTAKKTGKTQISEVQTIAILEKPDPHKEAREIYSRYLVKVEELRPHLEYADKVCKATSGGGKTLVEPLATMGSCGPYAGPLLCDRCKKPIILEGGKYDGIYADEAWAQNSVPDWRSYIKGGLMVEITTNGTLRIYHGYKHGDLYCCNLAAAELKKAVENYGPCKGHDKLLQLSNFLDSEFSTLTDSERDDILNNVMNTMYGFDPGIGVNRP